MWIWPCFLWQLCLVCYGKMHWGGLRNRGVHKIGVATFEEGDSASPSFSDGTHGHKTAEFDV